jgi:hypothetical protein
VEPFVGHVIFVDDLPASSRPKIFSTTFIMSFLEASLSKIKKDWMCGRPVDGATSTCPLKKTTFKVFLVEILTARHPQLIKHLCKYMGGNKLDQRSKKSHAIRNRPRARACLDITH